MTFRRGSGSQGKMGSPSIILKIQLNQDNSNTQGRQISVQHNKFGVIELHTSVSQDEGRFQNVRASEGFEVSRNRGIKV